MGRKTCCEKTGLKKGKWSAEEDEKLINYIKANGEGSWRSMPHNAGLLRCGRSCRLRWMNYLREDVKRGSFTEDEEETIVKLHITLGNRWSLIARNLPGRTDNEIKNYWNCSLSRRIHRFDSVGVPDGTIKILSTHKKRGGRFHRAVAKKYNNKSSNNNNDDDDNNNNIAADLPLTTSETSIFYEWTTPQEAETWLTYDEFDLDVLINYEREKEIINIENAIYQNDERDCGNIDWDLRGNVEDLNLWGEEEDMLLWSYLV